MKDQSIFFKHLARARHASCLLVLVISSLSIETGAQVLTPEITYNGPRIPVWGVSAEEARLNILNEDGRTAELAGDLIGGHYPKDSMLAVSASRAQAWVTELQSKPEKGLQLDPSGMISVMAHREDLAQRIIAERLAEPNLRFADRAYTLMTAVVGFASADVPTRLPVAENYLAQLDALGTPAAHWRQKARYSLMAAYHELGRSKDVIRLGMRAEELMGEIQYDWRNWRAAEGSYYTLCLALSGEPNGNALIRELNKKRMLPTKAPAELLARDSAYWSGRQMQAEYAVKGSNAIAERLGMPGTPLFVDYWINRGPTRDSQTVAVNDGKIRVIEFGGFGCEGCVIGMFMLERLHKRYPDIECNTIGHAWTTRGNRIVGAEAVAEDMADHILNKMHLTYPFGIRKPNGTTPTEDEGAVATYDDGIYKSDAYPIIAGPTIYIVDRKGLIRYVGAGAGLETEKELARVLDYLRKETGLKS